MGLTSEVIEEPESIRRVDQDEEYAAAKIKDLENIKETAILGDSTINLLKSHGISMMSDDDTSKDMLNTALQNGRQLVLSEGGKLLLNETKKIQNITHNNNNNNNINNNNNNNNSNNNLNYLKTMVPVRVHNENSTYGSASSANSPLNKQKPNIISKAKDNTNVGKNKNIRIISLNDFKKLYGSTNLKAMQKLPQTLSSQRLVNVRQPGQTKIQQIKIDTLTNRVISKTEELDDDENFAHIIQIETKDSGADTSETVYKIQQLQQQLPQQQHQETLIKQQQQQPQQQQQQTVAKQPVRIIPAKRVEHMGAVQVCQMPANNSKGSTNSGATSNQEIKGYTKSSATSTPSPSPVAGVTILSTPEICRQLNELRKQNEELRRKFDMVQTEKEDLRQRLERLEELLLVERTDDDS